MYVSKGCDFYQLVDNLKHYDFNNPKEITYLVGDLNFDAPGKNELSKYLSMLKFNQIVSRATHLGGHILDHVYVQEERSCLTEIKHHYIYYSDHDGILVSLKKDINL